jgi:valyl-tRNA synthetase
LISSGNAEEAKSAIDTLYTALEAALLMIHPFMPFLTEELWQRLPRRPEDKTPSICIAKFPIYNAELDDATSEEAYELLLDITKGLRSLTAEYAIKGEGKAFVQAFDDASFSTATAEAQSIQALAGKGIGSVEILDANAPTPDGCVVSAVSAKASVFLHVKGRVDVDAEIKKADSKLKKAQDSINKQGKLLNDKNFLSKATDELKEAEQKKLVDLEAVVRGIEETVKELQKLRI